MIVFLFIFLVKYCKGRFVHSVSQSHFNSRCMVLAKISYLVKQSYWPTNRVIFDDQTLVLYERYAATNLLYLMKEHSQKYVSVRNSTIISGANTPDLHSSH